MNKENQKKYNQYKKDKAKYDKLCLEESKLEQKHQQVLSAFEAASAKLVRQWKGRIEKANDAVAAAQGKMKEANAKLKETRSSFMAQDNPDRKELIKLILE